MSRRLPSIAVCLLLAAVASGDIVRLTNGQSVEGTVTQQDDNRVVIRTSGGELPLPRSSVASVEITSATDNALLAADRSTRAGNLLTGVRGILDAAEAGADAATLNGKVRDLAPVLTRSIPDVRAADRAELRYQLVRLEASEWLLPDARLALARTLAAIGADAEASDALLRAGVDAVSADAATAQWARDLLRSLVRRLVVEAKYREAIEQVERLRLLDGDAATAQSSLMAMAESARARDRGDYEKALRIIAEGLAPTMPEIARNRFAATLRRLVDWARREGREREARGWVAEYVQPEFPLEAIGARVELLQSEAERYLRREESGMALRVLDTIPEAERPPALQQLWLRATFASRRADIADEDALALFELAQWGSENGLEQEAMLLLEQVRENELFRAASDEQRTLMRRERDQRALERGLELFDQGLLQEVMTLCDGLLLDPARETSIAAQARELQEMARRELVNEKRRRPYQAEAMYQQAERAYFTQSLEESWNLIDVILTHYPDTPAAQRAARLLPEVARAFEMQVLEGTRRTLPERSARISLESLQQSDRLGREVAELLKAIGEQPIR